MRSGIAAAGVTCALALFVRDARAEPTPADRALATALFEEGRALSAAGRTSEACPKFAESQRLDPGAGTLLNLANCHEQEGKTATAWSEFHDALAVAEREGHGERIAFARAHIEALRPRLSRIVILVPDEIAGIEPEIARDGTVLSRVAIGGDMPLDPGTHRIDVRARGHAPWSASFEIAAGERREISVGPLLRLSEPPPEEPPRPAIVRDDAPEPRPETQKTVGWVVGLAGIATLAVGTVSGVIALDKNARSESRCAPRCNEEGYDLNGAAKTAADVSTVTLLSGAVLLGVGVALVLTSPKHESRRADRATLTFRF